MQHDLVFFLVRPFDMVLHAMGLEIDVANGEVRRGGERLDLPPRAIEMLGLLVAEPGKLVTRDAIHRALWKEGVHVDFERSVNIYITQLRKAFGDDARSPRYIETVPRRGYRFIAPVERDRPRGVVLMVLPFDGPDEDYFAAGMMEELILELGQLNPSELRVIARTTAVRCYGSGKDISQIADELGLDYVIEGSVRRGAGRVRIGVRLVETAGQTQIWADAFEDELADVLRLQNRIARAIATRIRVRIPGTDVSRSAVPDALEAYLKGRHLFFSFSPDDTREGVQWLQKAIELDPNFADAHLFYANSLYKLSINESVELGLVRQLMRLSAERAVEIAPHRPGPWAIRAMVRGCVEWDWPGADADIEKAFSLGTSMESEAVCAYTRCFQGRFDEAIEGYARAYALDPMAQLTGFVMSWIYHRARRYEKAISQFLACNALSPDFALGLLFLGDCYAYVGEVEKALDTCRPALEQPANPEILGYAPYIYVRCGERGKARDLFDRLSSFAESAYVDPYYFACAHAALGEIDAAFDWLDRAVSEHSITVALAKIDSFLDPLRDDPRFDVVLKKLGFQ